MVKKKKQKSYKDSEEGLGIVGFTLGVLSIIFIGSIGIITAIVGFIFCHVQQKKVPTKLARTGMILNIIGLIAGIVFLIVWAYYVAPAIADQIASFPK